MKQATFEQQVTRLEKIAESLERADVPLDEAMKLFEEGIVLLRAAQATLADADGRVKELVERADGALDTVERGGNADD
ncbi:MAG: exodeoxyribonuclease VII small subunit [Gemmatimonadetes bacterium]|nr:exodeoxyribonuclease VII small subunit [Gemmatimonadota bacterium]